MTRHLEAKSHCLRENIPQKNRRLRCFLNLAPFIDEITLPFPKVKAESFKLRSTPLEYFTFLILGFPGNFANCIFLSKLLYVIFNEVLHDV